KLGPNVLCGERIIYRFPVCGELIAHWEYGNLDWCEPKRECACEMFDDNRKEPFNRSHDSGMDHDDSFMLATFINTGQVETFGHIHVELNGRDLPFAAKRILCHEVELGTIERCLTHSLDPVRFFSSHNLTENV